VLGRNKPREYLNATRADREVVIAAAKRLPTALYHPQAPALTTISGCELVQMNDTMRDAVDRTISAFGREIIQHDHSRLMLCEIVLERENLTPITQGALRKQPNLGETVDHDPFGLDAFNGCKDTRDGLAKLEIGRIE
jgi:hypothetical protein